ncbi:MAG: phosphoglucomutase [Desulfuromonadales bacterium C00003096]|jgi:mannose-1-phosphate guanylyltransferase / phosphomannomutase|nr:MAG: phosphoglucomutase [Desulfuromonadales bacterium C00003096]
MKAVIMAGGFGTRIQPLTINMPKPMIPLVNRPIMLHIVELLKQHGISELIMLLYHQPEVIKHYFGDGSEFGVRITYVTPLEDLGTAGAVKAAAAYLDERFMLISGDLLTDFDLSSIISFHEQKQAKATITLTPVTDPLQFGVVITDKQDRITKFLEKPGWGEVFSDTINTGIYILEPEVLDLIPEGQNRDWSKDIFPQMLADQAPLFGCNQTGYWADIGNTDSYLEASQDILQGKINVHIDESPALGLERIYLGEETVLSNGQPALLEGMVVIGSNTQIKGQARLKNCIIGRNCVIEDGVELENTVVWDNVYLKRDCRIQGAGLCHRIRMGRGVVIEEGAILGDDTTVGDEVFIKKDVKIWPNKIIEGGSIVTTNLIWGDKWRKTLFDGALVRGLTNIELTPEFCAKLGAAYGSTLPRGSYVLAGRDVIRSSRMLKRSFVGGLLSAGINVRDTKRIPLPVLRYKLTTFGEVGGVHFRQGREDLAATEIVFHDADGMELSSGMAKGIERVFFKENFRRVHFSEPGAIKEIPQIFDYYCEGFLRALDGDLLRSKAPKVVLDLNHSPAGELLPRLLTQLGCQIIELNSNVDESVTGSSPEDIEQALDQLSRIVTCLGATVGCWICPSGEQLRVVDETGTILSEIDLLNCVTSLVCRAEHNGVLVMPVAAPETVEQLASDWGMTVKRTKNNARSLVEAGSERQVQLVAAMDGRLAFPPFQPHFDGLFSIAKILELLARTEQTLGGIRQTLPIRSYRQTQVPCSWELKGGLMRKMSEHSVDLEASFLDGVKVRIDDDWVLVLPDQHRPIMHIIAESAVANRADTLLETYCQRIEEWKQELLQV